MNVINFLKIKSVKVVLDEFGRDRLGKILCQKFLLKKIKKEMNY